MNLKFALPGDCGKPLGRLHTHSLKPGILGLFNKDPATGTYVKQARPLNS